ncbi:MAG: DUF1987 domain-containing protein [Flavobacteriales bacterium]
MPSAPVYRSEPTDKAPAILLDPSAGLLELSGYSIPENADRVYAPLFDAVEAYAQAPLPRTLIRIGLTYFNSSTAKYLLDLLKRFEDLHAGGQTKVVLEWRHAPGDLDMKEAGGDYRGLLEFPVKLVEDLI